MEAAVTIGLDLGKSVFQVHGVDSQGTVVVQRRIVRARPLAFFAKQPACLVEMEACAAAHHWARELQKLGHRVKLMPPRYVKPYVKRQKNVAADAEAICEAVTRPNMRCGRISIGNGPSMPLEPLLLIIKPPNTAFAIEVDGARGPKKIISRDCWKQHDGVLRIGMPTEKPEVIQICGFFTASFGQSVGLFRELREPVVEKFEPTDKIDLKLREAVEELCAQEIGMGAMTASPLSRSSSPC